MLEVWKHFIKLFLIKKSLNLMSVILVNILVGSLKKKKSHSPVNHKKIEYYK